MGRNRTFDEVQVLDSAMHAFRRHGYGGVSIKQLEQATGLTAGSLYNAFGDKEGLFRAALGYYVDSFVAARLGTHAGAQATLEDLEELFLSLFREPLTDGYGCLVTNSAIEFGVAGGPEFGDVGRALDIVGEGMRAVLTRELGAENADVAAAHLSLLYQGALVLSRAGRLDESLANTIRDHFRLLRQRRDLIRINPQPT